MTSPFVSIENRHDPPDALARERPAERPPGHGLVGSRLRRIGEAELRARRRGDHYVPPNTQQKYSNLAYQLLGEIVARRSGVPYPEYVRTRILDPLGMHGSQFEPLPETLLDRRATGYAARFLSDEPDSLRVPPTVWAEGGLWSSVEHLGRWLSFQFREDGGAREGAQILAGETLKESTRPGTWVTTLGPRPSASGGTQPARAR